MCYSYVRDDSPATCKQAIFSRNIRLFLSKGAKIFDKTGEWINSGREIPELELSVEVLNDSELGNILKGSKITVLNSMFIKSLKELKDICIKQI